MEIDVKKIAGMIDHTLLKANAEENDIKKLCKEAMEYNFASVCINPSYITLASNILKHSKVKITTVIGFPLGANTTTIKNHEAREAIDLGADEIDMVINIGALKSKNYTLVSNEIKTIRQTTKGKILKVIIETAYLNREEKIKVCEIAKEAGVDFVKTSTGFAPSGANVEDVKLMKEIVGEKIGVKASGGIRDLKTAIEMIKAGATRLGTSSGVLIIKGKADSTNY